jgi:two-component system, chemotaxis family, sensor kinase Cph1
VTEPKRLLAALGTFALACVVPRIPRQVECDAVLKRALEAVRPALEAAGGSTHGGSLPVVRADPRQLRRVFQALLGNAIRHRGPDAPVIHISARPAGREWLFTVRDNGRGIEMARHHAIFSPFSGARELPACAQILRRHGGRIWVESAEEQGATFCFTLPATSDLEFAS